MLEKYNSTAHALKPLAIGTRVVIQNNTSHGRRLWNRTGTIVESLPHRQYTVKTDGSGRVTLRNRRFLRPDYVPPQTFITPSANIHHTPSSPLTPTTPASIIPTPSTLPAAPAPIQEAASKPPPVQSQIPRVPITDSTNLAQNLPSNRQHTMFQLNLQQCHYCPSPHHLHRPHQPLQTLRMHHFNQRFPACYGISPLTTNLANRKAIQSLNTRDSDNTL